MNACRTIKTNRVLTLDGIAHTETIGPIDLGRVFPSGSSLEGEVHVVIEECDPQFDIDKDVVEVQIEVMIQKELRVIEPGQESEDGTPFEFAFRRVFVCPLDSITPSQIEAMGIDLDRVRCQVMNISVEDSVTFDPGGGEANASFTESLELEVGLTLDVLEIMDVVVCDEEPDE